MNINAGISSYNLNLKKNKEEKRPTFATIFDKLDARSKKLNSKNPLNAVLTNEQQYRYYLEETEPMLHNNDDTFDLDDVVGNRSLKDMKLSEFAKLLSGNLENDAPSRYETLQAIVSSNASAPLVPSSITISSTPAPAPVVPPPATPATPAPAAAPAPPPSGSSGTGTAPAPPPSGSSGTGTAPSAAAPSAAAPGSGLSIAIPPAGSGSSGTGSTPTGSTAGGIVSGIASAASGLLSSAKSLLSSPKPPTGGPSGTSVPTSAVASAATTAPATGVPTATPASGASSPAAAGSSPAAAGSSPAAAAGSSLTAAEIAAASMTSAELAGHKKKEDIEAYIDGVNKGLNPPEKPASLKGAIDIEDKEWVRYTIALITHNKMADKPFLLSAKQQQIAKNYEQALATTADKSDIESIIQNTIIIAQTPKPKSGKGGKKKK